MGDLPVKGRGRCPRCGSRKVANIVQGVTDFYARTMEACRNCKTTWEPMPTGGSHLDDDGAPFAFPKPCDNCAFRPGSPEQKDIAEWKRTMASLKSGAQFYCHKGVPIEPASEDGFTYPKSARKMRLCRGYLNMIGMRWRGLDDRVNRTKDGDGEKADG